LRRVVSRAEVLISTRKKDSLMKQADLRDMLKEASKSNGT
jgi:hypothetical protein